MKALVSALLVVFAACTGPATTEYSAALCPGGPPPVGIRLSGQSNAQGRKPCATVTVPGPNACATRPDIPFFDREDDSPVTAANRAARCPGGVCPVDSDDGLWAVRTGGTLAPRAGGNFGTEMAFAQYLQDLGLSVGVAKTAVGSTSKAKHWGAVPHVDESLNNKYCTGANNPCTPTPWPVLANGTPDPVNLIARSFENDDRLEAAGYPVRYDVHIQGEHDAAYSSFASHYGELTSVYVEAVRARHPGVVVILVRLHSGFILNATQAVRTAQEDFVRNYPLDAQGHPQVLLINDDDQPHDSAHLLGDGLMTTGLRVGRAIWWAHGGFQGGAPEGVVQ